MAIQFYRASDAYGCFSNFSNHPVVYKWKTYPTSEHAFQAMKFEGTQYEEQVRLASTPAAAAKMGRKRSLPLRPDWENVKVPIMLDIVLLKVEQHPEVKALLLSTGKEDLVEHTTNDSFWADGGDGSGKNMLGKILMEIRESLVWSMGNTENREE